MWTSKTGTLFYKAPEMFNGSYTNKIDVWAAGIVAYELMHGKHPFISDYVD
jgi:serine/threonine protein kinase